LLGPFALLVAFAGVMIIALALKAEDLAADAGDSLESRQIQFNAVAAVDAGAKLILVVGSNEEFA
jgi:hypothetical protein